MATPEAPPTIMGTEADEAINNTDTTELSTMVTPKAEPVSPASETSASPLPSLHDHDYDGEESDEHFTSAPLNITHFDGAYWNFKPFWEHFQSIHNNRTLSPSDKMYCLQAKCIGAAEQKLGKWKVTDEAYGEFVKLLHYTYGDNDLAVQKLYDSFDKLKPSSDYINHIRLTASQMDHFLKLLEYHGESIDNGMIRQSYMNRFPEWVKDAIPQKARGSIKTIQKAVRVQIGRLKRAATRKPPPQCLFCGKHKYTSDCRNVRSVEERLTLLHQRHRCLNCLGSNHFARDCKKEVICYHCKSNHNTALCRSIEGDYF
uniref:CCHC-type domain-containing protein n=1 Tax=Panagrellus redivivus TaxID=6233 RepID=A0A7E4VFD9_PANRE